MQLILGSTSRYRRDLLSRLGMPFECRPPQVDEEPYKRSGASPDSIAAVLAVAKAESLIGLAPNAAIIGSDQVVDLDGEVLGKPGSRENAIAQLERLSGRTHRLVTAIAVWRDYHTQLYVDSTNLFMRDLTRREIERYVDRDQPLDCAGSYKIESLGISLFESIDSSDQTAIVGLPLIALTRMLRQLGVELP